MVVGSGLVACRGHRSSHSQGRGPWMILLLLVEVGVGPAVVSVSLLSEWPRVVQVFWICDVGVAVVIPAWWAASFPVRFVAQVGWSMPSVA